MILLKDLPPKVLELAKKRIEEDENVFDENSYLSSAFYWRIKSEKEEDAWKEIYFYQNYEPLYQLYPHLRP